MTTTETPPDRLDKPGTVLAHAIALYRKRLAGQDPPQRTFNSGI
jgi:hypothetical protein